MSFLICNVVQDTRRLQTLYNSLYSVVEELCVFDDQQCACITANCVTVTHACSSKGSVLTKHQEKPASQVAPVKQSMPKA